MCGFIIHKYHAHPQMYTHILTIIRVWHRWFNINVEICHGVRIGPGLGQWFWYQPNPARLMVYISLINYLMPSGTYMCHSQWTGFSLNQVMTCINDNLLSIGPSGTNFSHIWVKIHYISFKRMYFKMSSAKMTAISSRPQCAKVHILWHILACLFR